MPRLPSQAWPALTVLLASVLVWTAHHELVGDLNDAFLDDRGDAIKNYYVVVHHVQQDSTYSRFEGMNYPFGEQVSLTDNQPLLSNGIKLASEAVEISGFTKGIMHGAILIGIIASSLLVFLILRKKELPAWYAIPTALGIAFLSPQLARMAGHFGLAHTFVFPLCWWLAIRFDERPSWKRSALIGLTVFLASGLHLYYFALTGIFLTFRWFVQWLQRRDRKPFALLAVKHWPVQVLLPFTTLQLWLRLTDTVRDRPVPIRLLGKWEGVFLPIEFPVGHWIDSLIGIRFIDYESLAYIGFPATMFTIVLIVLGLSRLRKKPPVPRGGPARDLELTASLAAATAMLLLAFGFPFVGPLDGLQDFSGPLRQLRALGRFTWAFFYVINVAAFVALYRWGSSMTGAPMFRRLTWFLPLAVLGYEAWYANTRIWSYQLARIPELAADAASPEWLGAVEPGRYQAIIPLPYFHVGAEYIMKIPTDESLRHTLVTSVLTGLPTTAVHSSRTSLSQTLDNLELVQEPYREPTLWQKVDPDRPFLVRQEKGEPLTPGERWLLDASVPLYEDDEVRLLEIDLTRWRERLRLYLDSTVSDTSRATRNESPDGSTRFLVRSFDDTATARSYRGPGALRGEGRRTVLFTGLFPNQDSVEYVFAAWVYLHGGQLLRQRLHYQEQVAAGVMTEDRSVLLGDILVLRDGDWGLVEFRFTPTSPDAKQSLFLSLHRPSPPVVWVDEVLIRRAADDIIIPIQDTIIPIQNEIFVNDRFYRPLRP